MKLWVSGGLVAALVGAGCGSDAAELPRLAEARGAPLQGECERLAQVSYPGMMLSESVLVAEGAEQVATRPLRAHCKLTGKLDERVSPVDGQTYAIGFEMRLPVDWNGRFYHQGNGGTDGRIVPAYGTAGGGGPLTHALDKGFAVISSDAGHSGAQNPLFGLDPQARIDYGYGAVQKLTPMAHAVIEAAYGKKADRSYIGGSSNGGRHAMIAAARMGDQYDGVLANVPGFNLPRAAVSQLYTAQQLRRAATDEQDLSTAFTVEERRLVADAVLARCDALDGLADGLVQDVEACRTAFVLARDVPTCTGERDGTCLSPTQQEALAALFQGPVGADGKPFYATQPFDPGLVGRGWASWKFESSVGAQRDPVAVGILFQVPPDPTVMERSRQFAFDYDIARDFPRLEATDATYTESAVSFMTPPNPTQLDTLRNRGGKMVVVHAVSDGVFSVDDTTQWFDALDKQYDGNAAEFARVFRVPGMNHGGSGPSTDQYDHLQVLIDWVERGQAPERIVASARGAGNPGGVNAEVPADWAADRTRPLCPYPLVARYDGKGDPERAASFACQR